MTKLALLLSLLPQDHADGPWHTERFENGVRIHVAEIADAAKFTVFSFLPVGLDGDPIGRAQFAHLAEHMLIRSTDPKRMRIGNLSLNGETTNQVMRLESLAPAAEWKGALLRHARWLTARKFDAATLEREKVRIAGEERGTVPRGYNHKWATAAWAQLVHGGNHAAVHGDVASATLEQVERYVAEHIRLETAQIFVAGPGNTADIVAALRAEFGEIELAKAVERKVQARESPKPAHRDATWDLDANHYLEWYELPADCSAAEAELLSQVLTMACFQHRFFREVPGRALAGSVRRQGQRFVLLSTNLPVDTKIAEVQSAFREVINRAPRLARLQVRGGTMADRFAKLPDFAAQRRQVTNPRIRKLIEANWAMQCGYACTRLGLSIDEVPAAYREVEAKRIAELIGKHCTPAARYSVRISFAKK